MVVRRSIALFGLAALVVAWAVLATGGSPAGIASILPVLLLLAPLLLRRYPGERRIARLRAGRTPPAGRSRAAGVTPRGLPRITTARGGLLLGRRLAVRPPPGLPAHA